MHDAVVAEFGDSISERLSTWTSTAESVTDITTEDIALAGSGTRQSAEDSVEAQQ